MSGPVPPEGPSVLLVAGEPSGDGHGAELVHALRRLRPDLRLIGTGGPRMRAAGQEQLFDLTEHAVVGLVEVLKHYPQLRGLFHQLIDLAKREQPEAVVFIDYPGFNLRLAAALRRALPRTKLIYYISPQVWAWKSGRSKKMARLLDLLIVLFKFEKEWFAEREPRLPVEWTGHPIWDRMPAQVTDAEPAPTGRVALLPGSREGELKKHLPFLVEAARRLRVTHPDLQFVWITPDAAKLRLGLRLIEEAGGGGLGIESYVGYPLSQLSRCDLALLASGTVSLECACMGVPQIVFYKVNPVTYFFGRMVVKTKYVSMVNLLADREVVPEYIQSDLDPDTLARRAAVLLDDAGQRREMRRQMRQVVDALGGPGASARAARLIADRIGK
jgi:lipid-A-disaccharide synthase